MSLLVLDASVTLCWLFEDQATTATEAILDRLTNEDEAVVAGIWPLEVVNAIVIAERRKLIRPAQSAAFIEQLAQLSVTIDSPAAERIFGGVLETARRYALSAYDAEYLELAVREGLPLATLDQQLRRAANTAGVRLI